MTMEFRRRRFLAGALGLPVAWMGSAKHGFAETGTLHEIEIKEFAFDPAILEVRPGDRIRWTNQDISPHTATADDGGWDTGELKKGESVTLEVTTSMTVPYFCAFHPTMRAKVVVL